MPLALALGDIVKKLTTVLIYGKPMSESDFQRESLIYAVEALNIYFQDRADVYVSGTLSMYYEEGNAEPVATPDVFVVFGVEKRQRTSYVLSQEGKVPDFVLEIISKSSLVKDLGVNRGTYAFVGVSEYFLYDPTGEAMNPPLRGLRLVGENYQQMPLETLEDGVLSLKSQVLGLEVRVAQGKLYFYNPETGAKLLNRQEAEQALKEAQARAEAEAAARQAAEERVAELEAQLREIQDFNPS